MKKYNSDEYKNRKVLAGQLSSAELIVSISFFVVALMVFFIMWNWLTTTYYEEAADKEMQFAAAAFSDVLIYSAGVPEGWDCTLCTPESMPFPRNAPSFGLAQSPNVLQRNKISQLRTLYYSNTQLVTERMGVGKYSFSVQVQSTNGSQLYQFGEFFAQNETVSSATVQRLAIMDGELVIVKVSLWRTRERRL
ncbi:MAG: hypothetical protein N3G22_04020 [Candidatus Micrarchaeota archaeon]|nr:hypothetical protein [Candidatus Micrarchaeota archaeon]